MASGLAVVLFCAVAGSAIFSSAALASPAPSLSWSLPRTANEGASVPFSWTGKRLGRNHRLVVQKPEGTAHTWRTIMRLSSNSGSAELPGLALGKYRFRIADLAGRRVLAQQTAGIAVFGEVPFSTLLRGTSPGPGVYATSQNSFSYATLWEPGSQASPRTAFSVRQNRCLSIHVAFIPGGFGYPNGSAITGTATLTQESRDPVSDTVAYNTIGSLDADLVLGQSWSLLLSAQGEHQPLVYVNGYAVCDSTEPFSS